MPCVVLCMSANRCGLAAGARGRATELELTNCTYVCTRRQGRLPVMPDAEGRAMLSFALRIDLLLVRFPLYAPL